MKKKSKFRREREREGTEEGLDLQELLSLSLVPEVTSSGRTRQVRVNTHTHTHIYEHTYNTHICKHMYKLAFTDVVSLFKTEFHPSSFYMWVSL